MTNKNHLTEIQRYQIAALLQAGHSQKEISMLLFKDKSVISRELKRNSSKHGVYHAGHAQRLSDERKERFKRPRRLTVEIKKRVLSDLQQEQWSPRQIVGLARLEGRPMVSHETIYRLVRDDKANGGTLFRNLRHQLKHRKRPVSGKQVNIKNKVSIDQRPGIINNRERFGDFEIDTIIGKDNKGAIVTLTERKTNFLIMEKLEKGKNARELARVVVRLLLPYKNLFTRSPLITGLNLQNMNLLHENSGLNFISPIPILHGKEGSTRTRTG